LLRRVVRRAPFFSNDVKQLGALRAATRRIAIMRRACIFVDIYKRAYLSRCIAAQRLTLSGLCPPACVLGISNGLQGRVPRMRRSMKRSGMVRR